MATSRTTDAHRETTNGDDHERRQAKGRCRKVDTPGATSRLRRGTQTTNDDDIHRRSLSLFFRRHGPRPNTHPTTLEPRTTARNERPP
ncbi:hypothetical protein K443DRAFT_13377 [Laccaria amethystina LaAM-08-1]|uniref:Uncharacterized protein n=1 Tax=Laccaria amethystina LaAM-08-1 TaxID=1095629 RepID=A0A0C9WID2_9AGAR|nr:hypothetical protein K443DRAFT_13377 [Laccaria amethystina LaAM-08-1]